MLPVEHGVEVAGLRASVVTVRQARRKPHTVPVVSTPQSRTTVPGVIVVTDSTSYMPAEMIDSLGVRHIELYVGWDGDLRPEHDYVDLDAFYRRLEESPELPTTS